MKKPENIINVENLSELTDDLLRDLNTDSWGAYEKPNWIEPVFSGRTIRKWILKRFSDIKIDISDDEYSSTEKALVLKVKNIKFTDGTGLDINFKTIVLEEEDFIKLTLNPTEGSFSGESSPNKVILVAPGDSVNLASYTPSRVGYTFSGWYTSESGGSRINTWKATSDLTLYAGWTEQIKVWFIGLDEKISEISDFNDIIETLPFEYISQNVSTGGKNITTYNYYVIIPNSYKITSVKNSLGNSYLRNFVEKTDNLLEGYKIYSYSREVQASITLNFIFGKI